MLVMKAWASSGRGRGVDVCHLSAPCELRNTMLGALCWSEMRRCGSGYFQWGISSSTAAFLSLSLSLFFFFFTGFFPTEGKQMRLNINSRLLMQHCAKICAPAAWIERTARLKRERKKRRPHPHPPPLLSLSPSCQTSSF